MVTTALSALKNEFYIATHISKNECFNPKIGLLHLLLVELETLPLLKYHLQGGRNMVFMFKKSHRKIT